MPLDRRHAAAGLLVLAGAGLPLRRARAQAAPAAPITPPDEPPPRLDTGRDAFEHMLAPVSINGQGPFQFLIDTGANTSCISHALAEKLMLAGAEPALVHTIVGARQRPGVLIDRLQVGQRNRKGVRAAALPLEPELDGVLGVDWLAGQRLELGFKTRSLAITRSRNEFSRAGLAVVPARRRQGQLTIVDADLGGRRISAMIDSGSQMSLCNGPLQALITAGKHRDLGEDRRRVNLETLIGERFSGDMTYLPFLRLGGLQLGNVPVVFADMPVFELWGLKTSPAVVLGMDLLTQFDSVALDYGRGQVSFALASLMGPPPLVSLQTI